MWILTEEYNDYDQHGEYFLHAWLFKPTKSQLLEHVDGSLLDHILAGGGRLGTEHVWYYLRELHNEIKTVI